MLDLRYLAGLVEEHSEALEANVSPLTLRGRTLPFGQRPVLMGVINLSPDSWYRESVCLNPESAVRRGRVLAAQGADLVDVGAESTLAHAARVEDALQESRLLPVVRELAAAGLLVSVETYSARVARAALEAGASVINLTGTAEADAVYELVAAHDAAVILCYVQGPHVRAVGDFVFTPDLLRTMHESFAREIERARHRGVEKIILDPGLGFYYRNLQDSAARVRHQMRVFLHTFRLRTLGCPVCHALPHAFEYFGEEVRCAEPFFAVLAALGRTDLFRTHEIPRVKAVLDTLQIF
ncbi:dihydropteroate synthase [Limisphaera sp. VF-2]|jgi:dihydropteroate synthase|uniref:dihydropteroate synthase n=1 Tax=Limisphaera sp. VF-2 TaxID=3400418 RepID=UPI00177596A7|nr:dihydropteroate synthase [Limisphaera sp.]